MPGILDYAEFLPVEKRELFQLEASKLLSVQSMEDADKVSRENEFFKRVFDQRVSASIKTHDERFKTEVLPNLLESEILKRNPPKDPRDLKVHEMEQKLAEIERREARAIQKSKALLKAGEFGIPAELVDYAIGDNDEATEQGLNKLVGILKPWQETAIKNAVSTSTSQQTPKGGQTGQRTFTRADMLTPEGRKAYMDAGGNLPIQD